MARQRITVVIKKGVLWQVFTDIPKTKLDLELIDLDTDDEQVEQDCLTRIGQIARDDTMREVTEDEY